VLGAIGIRSAPKLAKNGNPKIHPRRATNPIPAADVPKTWGRKFKGRLFSLSSVFIVLIPLKGKPRIQRLTKNYFPQKHENLYHAPWAQIQRFLNFIRPTAPLTSPGYRLP
jgi:hypothetical protein